MHPGQDKRGKYEDEHELSPFEGIQRNAVLHEARCFHDQQLDARKCVHVMTKLLYLLVQGEEFMPREMSELFFAVTKLFQSPDVHLRRMIYLIIKELNVGSDESLIVVSCLSKDMNSRTDLFRANAIRVLAKIIDASMLGQIDRFLKQAIVHRNPFIVSSALVAGIQLYQRTGPELIKRWVNEVQEALNSSSKMNQFHALTLLYQIKQHDRLAISKVVTALARRPPKGPLAQCLLIRYISSVLETQYPPDRELLKYLKDCLHNKNYVVMYESARALCQLQNLGPADVEPAIGVLQEFLTSPIPAQRFAAVRTLSQVVTRFPNLVAQSAVDLEHLITDNNRSIATLAITTLLKTGLESSVDRLMKSISGFMSEISDEFKVVLVNAVKALCLKFPHKHSTLMNFLASSFREEGGFLFKKAIVSAMLDIVGNVASAKEEGLEHFCEFIEDCEFPELSVKILHLLGNEGQRTANAAKYVRYIFNRTILESACVRAAAVSALGKYGAALPELTPSIIILLKRCLNDNDDEVRDRVVLYLDQLQRAVQERAPADAQQQAKEDAAAAAIGDLLTDANSDEQKQQEDATEINAETLQEVRDVMFEPLDVSLKSLELSLRMYIDNTALVEQERFSLAAHKVEAEEDGDEKDDADVFGDATNAQSGSAAGGAGDAGSADGSGQRGGSRGGSRGAGGRGAAAVVNPYLELLSSIPEFAELGPVFKSSKAMELTEEESEYFVSCVKHVFERHVVFQFNVTNNMEDQLLKDVQVEMETDDEDAWVEEMIVPEAKLAHGTPGTTFVCLSRPEGMYSSTPMSCTLKFLVCDVDTSTGEVLDEEGIEEEYNLEEVEVAERDFVAPGESFGLVEFRRQWEGLTSDVEVVKKYSLGLDDLQVAVDAVIEMLGLQACEDSGTVPEDKRSHACNLYGKFIGDVPVLCRAGFMLDAKHGVTLKIAVRCQDPQVATMLSNCVR
eukprot:TRINITY_DN65761_c11_g3_i1.p1 TRINITY_DN65761_c11_g3~~TRINITY_DN65761_c11_g3_i1.p1  ORF type:complete len:961 (+),score=596.77 TRINITY_DN65761_c11_g3_i1:134-3016(+)